MREVQKRQMQFGQVAVEDGWLDPKSRDDIPAVLRGLQHVYVERRDRLFGLLEAGTPPRCLSAPVPPERSRAAEGPGRAAVPARRRSGSNAGFRRPSRLAAQSPAPVAADWMAWAAAGRLCF